MSTFNRKHNEYLQQKTYWVPSTENVMSTFKRKHIEYLQQKTENILSTFNRKQKTDWDLQQKTENIEYLQQKT